MRWSGWLEGVVAFCMLGAGACRGANGEAKVDATAKAATTVSVARVVEEDVIRRVTVTGTLAPWEEAVVSIEVEGRILELPVDLGARVRKGEALARVASEEYGWRKTQAEAELAAAEADFRRVETLGARDIATRQQLDEARRRLDVARNAASLARKKLADTTLRAPFDGAVSRRLVNAGEYVRAGTPAFQVVRVSPLKLKADTPERHAGDVAVGDPVEVVSESFAGTLAGKVVRVGPAIAAESRSFPVEAEIANPGDAVKPGTFVRASIVTAKSGRGLTVPETAVALFAGNPRVYVVADGKARERPIEVAGRVGDRVVVGKGLQVGETVAVTGADLLADGAAVAVRPEAAR